MSVRLSSGELLRQLGVRGLSQQDVAELSKLSPTTVSAAVRGHRVRPATLRRLAMAINSVPVVEGAEALVAAGPPD